MKKYIALLLTLGMATYTISCTSGGSDESSDAQELADTDAEISDVASGGDEAAAAEEAPAGDEFAESGDEAGGDDFGSDEDFAEGDEVASDDGALEGAPADDTLAEAPAEAAPADDFMADAPAEAAPTEDLAASEPAPVEDPSSSLAGDEMAGMSGMTDFSEPSAGIPLKKMISTPYRKAGVLVNSIYIARSGDTLSSISQKIYGMDKTAELQSVNGHLASRDVVVGDKVYYNSPVRPNDESQVKVFYEDMNLAPENYVAVAGDNIRGVGKKLLGHEKSWKELYATNLDVDSKGELMEGTQLRYWGSELGGVTAPPPAPVVAANDTPAQDDFSAPPPPPPEFSDVPPPNMAATTNNELPPPPPPEPPQDQFVPPPAPPAAAAEPAGDVMSMLGDETTLIALAVILFAAAALVVVVRKRKSRRNIDFHTATHTQLD